MYLRKDLRKNKFNH